MKGLVAPRVLFTSIPKRLASHLQRIFIATCFRGIVGSWVTTKKVLSQHIVREVKRKCAVSVIEATAYID